MQPQSGKFCPSCKLYNEPGAIFCVHCGTPFEEANIPIVTTSRFGMPESTPPEPVDHPLQPPEIIPESGIAFFFVDEKMPFELRADEEFVVGRKTDDSPEKIVDLINYDAFGHGVSRRHAKIRRAASGYEIIDLESTNGTWVNEQRLNPNKPYPLASGSMLRLGRMRIYVMYKEPEK
jgi:pSer/pThr/pTyr-binding forkhead associated (FHA) protein